MSAAEESMAIAVAATASADPTAEEVEGLLDSEEEAKVTRGVTEVDCDTRPTSESPEDSSEED